MKKYIFILLLILPTLASGATYNYQQGGSGSRTNACGTAASIADMATDSASAGDIINICNDGGTVTTTVIANPAWAGTVGSPIYIQNEADAAVLVEPASGQTDCVTLNGAQFVVLRANPSGGSITLHNPRGQWVDMQSSHLVVDGITMTAAVGWTDASYRGIQVIGDDFVIRNCSLSAECEPNDLIWVEGADHGLIENNTFGTCAHLAINLRGGVSENIIIKDNVLENTHHSNIGGDRAQYVLVEGNISKNAGGDCATTDCIAGNPCAQSPDDTTDSWNHSNMQTNWDNSIARYNLMYSDGAHSRVGIEAYSSSPWSGGSNTFRIYNNTFADMCMNLWTYYSAGYSQTDNIYIDNIFLDGGTACSAGYNYNFRASFYDSTNKLYTNIISGTGTVSPSLSSLNTTYGSGNISTDPSLDANYQLQVGSVGIDGGRPHTYTNGTGSSSSTLVVDDGEMFFSKEAWNFDGTRIASSYINSDLIYVAASSPFTVRITNRSGNTLTLASAQTWQDGVGVYYLYNDVAISGSEIDIGAFEYDSGVPVATPAVYELDANGNDTNGNYNLTGTGGTPDHTGGEGVVVDENTDAYYKGSAADDMQITEIACINLAANSGSDDYPIAGRYDIAGGRNLLMSVDRYGSTGAFKTIIGYNSGASVENYTHSYVIPTSTDIWVAHTIDGTNKLLNQYVMNSSGTELGTDVENQAILSARTWNYNESSMLIGVIENGGSRFSGYFTHGTVKYFYRVVGILPRADIVNIVTSASPASPSISSNCWSSDGTNCLSADWEVGTPGTSIYHLVVGSEAFYSEGGPATFAAQVTVGGSGSKTLTYSSGYGTTTLVFKYTTHIGDYVADFQLASTSPISEGTDNIVDSESNAFTLTGLDNALTYAPTIILRGRTGTAASGCVMR